jgi:hypothetical protein
MFKDMLTLKFTIMFTVISGQNVRHIVDEAEEVDIFRINKTEFKRKFRFNEMPTDEAWKVNLVKEITDINYNVLVLSGDEPEDVPHFTKDELNDIMDYVATF